MPKGNRSKDEQIIDFVEAEQRIVITKDGDFVNSHVLFARPARLLLVSTGNISNQELEQLIVPLIPTLLAEFQTHSFIALGRSGITVRG